MEEGGRREGKKGGDREKRREGGRPRQRQRGTEPSENRHRWRHPLIGIIDKGMAINTLLPVARPCLLNILSLPKYYCLPQTFST